MESGGVFLAKAGSRAGLDELGRKSDLVLVAYLI